MPRFMKLELPSFLTALGLSLGVAISLGMSRFSYALLLPPMRDDLGWSYLLAGSMNTANAFGYFCGALATPWLMQRFGIRLVLIAGALLTAGFLLLSGVVTESSLLLALRACAGIASALTFVTGGVLAARLGAQHPQQAGLMLGLYYGGAGFGIVVSAQLVPYIIATVQQRSIAHAWQWAWIVLALICLIATSAMAIAARRVSAAAVVRNATDRFHPRDFFFGLAGYTMFGVGYIGYMTFIVALLKQQGMGGTQIVGFYTLLGIGVLISSFIWARMLDRFKGGQSMAILNLLLALATLLPILSTQPSAAFISGLLFGAVFLSVVASTTALVRHNLPQSMWSAGISAFTIVFAIGQIVGPVLSGWVSDGVGGLQRGFIFSALSLLLGAAFASCQRQVPLHADL